MGLIVLGVGDHGQRDETLSLCEGWVLGWSQPASPPHSWLLLHHSLLRGPLPGLTKALASLLVMKEKKRSLPLHLEALHGGRLASEKLFPTRHRFRPELGSLHSLGGGVLAQKLGLLSG